MKPPSWTSALTSKPPPIPALWHWSAGVCVALAVLCVSVYLIAQRSIPEEIFVAEPDRMLVALGAPAQRLEPPPPPPPDAPPPEPDPEPQVPTERAEEAPPPAPPDVARQPIVTAPSNGRASSGLGDMREPTPPPPPPPPPPVELKQRFIDISARQYTEKVKYPYEALRRNQQGTGQLLITVSRNGTVNSWILKQSTGHKLLDREIERVARSVKRIDPLPDYFERDRAVLIIPFTFVMGA